MDQNDDREAMKPCCTTAGQAVVVPGAGRLCVCVLPSSLGFNDASSITTLTTCLLCKALRGAHALTHEAACGAGNLGGVDC